MQNSLAHYDEFCEKGTCLIYTVHKEAQDKIEAAFEINSAQGTWRLAQASGPRHIRPTPKQMAIAEHTADTVRQQAQANP